MADIPVDINTLLNVTLADGQQGTVTGQKIRTSVVSVISALTNPLTNTSIATITDGGTFGDGLTHQASANGYATLAALQAAYQTATFTATGSGTNLTISSVTGRLFVGDTLGITPGISAGTTIVSQTSGTVGSAGVYVTNQLTTISSATATSSPAQALTDDITGLIIQAALNQTTIKGGEIVILPPGKFVLSSYGLYYDGSETALHGSGPLATTLLCQNCSGGAAITLYGKGQVSALGFVVAKDFGMWAFNSGVVNNGNVSSSLFGVASTTCYTVNSVGILISSIHAGQMEGIFLSNFDNPIDWNHTTGNSWIWTFVRCYYYNSNHGISINGGAPNSFERMAWQNCVVAGNNQGVFINPTNSPNIGGAGQGSDFYIDNCSIDYNVVRQITFLGGASLASGDVDDVYPLLRISGGHIETNSNNSGTALSPLFNDGNMVVQGVQCFLDGTYPPSFVQGTSNSRLTLQGCHVPGGFPPIPIYAPFAGSTKAYRIHGGGNIQRTAFSGDCILISDSNGIRMDEPSALTSGIITTTTTTTALALQRYTQKLSTNTSACTLTVLTDTNANHMIGTTLLYVTTGTSVWTITPQDGTVTINMGFGATGLTFGGAPGKVVALENTDALTWLAYGGLI